MIIARNSISAALIALLLVGHSQFETTAAAAAPEQAASATQPITPYHIRFAPDCEVEIIAVGRDPLGQPTWWLPDGTPLTRAPINEPIDFKWAVPPFKPDEREASKDVLIVLAQARFPKTTIRHSINQTLDPAPSILGYATDKRLIPPNWASTSTVNAPMAGYYHYPQGIPAELTLSIEVVAGPWTPVASTKPKQAMQKVTMDSLSAADGQVRGKLSFDAPDEKLIYSIFALDTHGQRLKGGSQVKGRSDGKPVTAPIIVGANKAEDIDRIEVVSSPFHRIVFKIAGAPAKAKDSKEPSVELWLHSNPVAKPHSS